MFDLKKIVLVLFALCLFFSRIDGTAEGLSEEEKLKEIDRLYEKYRMSFEDIADLSVDEFLKLRAKREFLVVDVRSAAERKVSKIPGSISRKKFEKLKKDLKEQPVLVYCTIGARSGEYAKKLILQNIEVYNLRGSILKWAHEGQGLVDDNDKPTTKVHIYGSRWNLLPDSHEGVW